MDKPFWETLADYGNAIALEQAESRQSLTYRALATEVAAMRELASRRGRGLAFVFGENDIGGIISYLACLQAGHAVYLLATKAHHPAVERLIERYRPELMISQTPPTGAALEAGYSPFSVGWNYQAYVRNRHDDPPPDPDLALLLSTSASTGNPKTVRLAKSALARSAHQVIGALKVTSDDHAVTSLPFAHVYGLSVVNSHLAAGARISLEKRTVADAAFWSGRRQSSWTTLPGVTVTYEFMRQRNIDPASLAGIRKLLHSGSRMPAGLFAWLYSALDPQQSDLYLMYGQTEACGRMSVLQPHLLPSFAGSVGKPVADGAISLSGEQEIIYSGPNVMLGYADGRGNLNDGDQAQGKLPTGDRGYVDSNGLLFITGRRDRTCKIYGQRVSLDDIEELFHDVSPTAALCRADRIVLFSEADESDLRRKLVKVATITRLPPQVFVLCRVERLPRTETGKVCYQKLGTSVN